MHTLLRSAVLLVGAAVSIACTAPASAPGGWYDAGVHAVDGYYVTAEERCGSPSPFPCEEMAFVAALAALQESEPGAVVVGVSMAGYPNEREREGQVDFVFAGLQTPRFVILDIGDGTRRTIGMMCGALSLDNGQVKEGCVPNDLEKFRVSAAPGA
jgi:hypothetical protein